MKNKVHIVTLGCPKNEVDSEVMAGLLRRSGMEIVADPEESDLILVNTCTFIDDAKEESVGTILEIAGAKGERRLLVTGCMAEQYGEELLKEIPEIDSVLGVRSLDRVAEDVSRILGRPGRKGGVPSEGHDRIGEKRALLGPSHTAWLKIAEGCGRKCSFCTIPSFRGDRSVSRSPESLVREANALAGRGAKEICLISQETTSYGNDLPGDVSLASLIDSLSLIESVRWLRILYAYPSTIGDVLIQRIVEGKICRYIDIPVQHISDRILRSMKRGMTGRDIRTVLERLRTGVPGIALRTSVLVGYPGETKEEFRCLRDFLEEFAFDHLGIFRFSPQEGTVAAGLPDPVPDEVALERHQELTDLQERIVQERNDARIGSETEILVDSVDEEGVWGRTESDAPEIDGAVLIPRGDAEPGDFLRVRITEAGGSLLVAEWMK